MKLTFLKGPSDIKFISLNKDATRLYIKKELLEYLQLKTDAPGQLSVATTDDGKTVLMDNSYYNNFRYVITKQGNPYINVKGAFDDFDSDLEANYSLETLNIGEKEDVPIIVITWEKDRKFIESVDISKED